LFILVQVAQKAALGYVGAPQDVANLVSFLASKESDFITGTPIRSDQRQRLNHNVTSQVKVYVIDLCVIILLNIPALDFV